MTDKRFKELVSFQSEIIAGLEKLHSASQAMLVRSEQRIDETNKMIHELSSTTAKLVEFSVKLQEYHKENTLMYDKHIVSVETSRDEIQQANKELIQQNSALMSVIDKMNSEIEHTRKQNERLIDILEGAIRHANSHNGNNGGKATVNFGKGSEELFK